MIRLTVYNSRLNRLNLNIRGFWMSKIKSVRTEFMSISKAWFRHGPITLPLKLLRAGSSKGEEGRVKEIKNALGDSLLNVFDALGPVYGKAAQVAMSRLTPGMHRFAESLELTRLYGDWPAIDSVVIESLLDREIPLWRSEFTLKKVPIGVASLGQVHEITDLHGRVWVLKIIKPHSRKRLEESLSALENLLEAFTPLAMTAASKKAVKECRELMLGLRAEIDLDRERKTIEQMQRKLTARQKSVLRIPEVYREYCTKNVLIIERFEGVPLSKVVADHEILPAAQRKKLARKILQELLVQVFEVGLFHGDPHAGNLILLEDGSIGLFDWGLAGELLESDRRHIAGMLKAVIALDMDQLVKVLIVMAQEEGQELSEDKVRRELKRLSKMTFNKEAAKKPSLHQVINACLKAANRLHIPVPNGLLLMAKSLITIEGLAKGIDPEVSMKRIAAPVLFRAARPGFRDFFAIAKRIPDLIKKG